MRRHALVAIHVVTTPGKVVDEVLCVSHDGHDDALVIHALQPQHALEQLRLPLMLWQLVERLCRVDQAAQQVLFVRDEILLRGESLRRRK